MTVLPALRLPAARRRRILPNVDVVDFIARCPACGADCEWLEERDDTRVRTNIACSCAAGNSASPEQPLSSHTGANDAIA